MHIAAVRRILVRFIFSIGLFLMLVGIAFLLGTLTGISHASVLVSFFFVLVGAFCPALAVKLNRHTLKRSVYLFLSTFFILVGLFLFLSALKIFPVPFFQAWPLLSIFSGLALIPAGWQRFGALRFRYIVPAITFIILGCILLVFSFDVVPFSFTQFVLNWWPLLVLIAGLILVLLSIGTKNLNADTPNKKDDTTK
ncbi:MAG: hypothetical protein LBS86_01250 [Treponema sp.]|jgi:hypothetical protein|nr:hypothetical protein [Treponema sp.]